MSIRCPHCNFEIILTGVRPGRFSPKCQSCHHTFTLYIPNGSEHQPMAARSHVELHEMCLRKGMAPPKPYPIEVVVPSLRTKTESRPKLESRQLVGAGAGAEHSSPPRSAYDMLGETDAVIAIDDEAEPSHPAQSKNLKSASRPGSAGKASEISAIPAPARQSPVRANVLLNNHFARWFLRRFGTPLDWIFGPAPRVVLGLIILAGFAAWFTQNRGEQTLQQAMQSVVQTTSARREISPLAKPGQQQTAANIQTAGQGAASVSGSSTMSSQILQISWLPLDVCRALSGWNALLAGLIVLGSAFFAGRFFALGALLAAAVAMVGYWYVLPQMGQPQPWMAAAASGAIAVFSFFVLRRTEGA